MTRRAREPVVPDTSCLIALTGIGRLDLLATLYARVVVPTAVQREFGASLPSWIETVELDVTARPLANALSSTLGAGESETIALAAEEAPAVVILDDQRARRVARDTGLRLTGTIGVLLRAKREGLLPSVGEALRVAERVGFRVSPALRAEALRLAGEAEEQP
jgi:predicted nucleic acid-binding protein